MKSDFHRWFLRGSSRRPLGRCLRLLFLFGTAVGAIHAASPPESTVDLSGTLEVMVADDFAGHHVEISHFLQETGTGRHFVLRFSQGPPPVLSSGTQVRVRGQLHGQELAVAALSGSATQLQAGGTPSPLVSGSQKTLVLLVNFTNAAVPCSVETVSNTVFSLTQSSVNTVYQETSFSNLLWNGLVAGPYTIDYGTSSCDPNGWANAADAAASAAGININPYDHKVYVLPNSGMCGWGGLATIGGNPSRAWISSCNNIFQYAHELGHGLGMNHASSDANNDGVVDAEYGDSSDFMSASYTLTRLNAPHMAQMAWTPKSKTQVLASSGTYRIGPLEALSTATTWPQMLTFPIPGSSESYYISYRQPIGLDANLSGAYTPGVSVHRWCCGNNTRLITVLSDGGTFTDDVSGFTLHQVSHTGSAATVSVELLANAPPVMPFFTAMSVGANGRFSLGGTGAVNQVYWLLASSNLVPPIAWTSIATNTADTNGAFTFSDLNATNFSRRFYRLRAP
ncbi:MAG TPA: hypothetical protein VN578_03785 [Candidatus Binatia bacterium]|nr:hypothetical protein [Candidatus Binatia bacterium]